MPGGPVKDQVTCGAAGSLDFTVNAGFLCVPVGICVCYTDLSIATVRGGVVPFPIVPPSSFFE